MIVVRVELHSAVTGKVSELARAVIHNTGGTKTLGNYRALTLRGRDKETFDKGMRKAIFGGQGVSRVADIKKYPRLRLHVWNLVAKALSDMGYGHDLAD